MPRPSASKEQLERRENIGRVITYLQGDRSNAQMALKLETIKLERYKNLKSGRVYIKEYEIEALCKACNITPKKFEEYVDNPNDLYLYNPKELTSPVSFFSENKHAQSTIYEKLFSPDGSNLVHALFRHYDSDLPADVKKDIEDTIILLIRLANRLSEKYSDDNCNYNPEHFEALYNTTTHVKKIKQALNYYEALLNHCIDKKYLEALNISITAFKNTKDLILKERFKEMIYYISRKIEINNLTISDNLQLSMNTILASMTEYEKKFSYEEIEKKLELKQNED